MNLMGKILVMVILVFSMVFMGITLAVYATHTNWRVVVDNPTAAAGKPLGLKQQLENLKAKNADLTAQVDSLTAKIETEATAYREQLAKLETNREALSGEQRRLQENLVNVTAQAREAAGAAEAAHETLSKLRDEIATTRTNLTAAEQEKDGTFDRLVKASDELFVAEGELDLLKQRNVQLAEDIARMEKVIDAVGADPHLDVDAVAPRVAGRILEVTSRDLVEISIGSDDGIRRGDTLEVFRQGATASKYLGKIEILRTAPDRAVGKIIPEFRKGRIQREDRVATRLN